MTITLASYDFSGGGLFISKPMEITRETEKCYFTKTNYGHGEFRFLKADLGRVKHSMRDNRPYIETAMIDTNEKELRVKLAEWFDWKAEYIKLGKTK